MAIKRRRKPTQTGNTDEQIQLSGPSISDVPITIFVDILLKLSTKSIVMCKCVCKTWRNIISDPQFARLHLAQSKTCLLIREDHCCLRISRALYLLEPEDARGWEDWYCWCEAVDKKCDRCRRNIKVETKLKIPLRNTIGMFSHAADDANVIFHTRSMKKWKHVMELKSASDHMYQIVNSCNGLLCLIEPQHLVSQSVVVCNPITGEFIHIPESCYDGTRATGSMVGLGFSPKNNQYKVISMFAKTINDYMRGGGCCYKRVESLEIHTLGTDSWRSVDISGSKIIFPGSLTYLNGACHWILVEDNKDMCCIVSFDLDEEQFHFNHVPLPPCAHLWTMGAIGGYLCLYDVANDHTCIWAMKQYGVWESLTKLSPVSSFDCESLFQYPIRRSCHNQPMIYLSNGSLLLFNEYHKKLTYFDPLRGQRFKYLKFRGIASSFEVIAHIPSFISLKDIVKTDKVEVLNVNSRCGMLRLLEETFPLFLGETKK